MADEVEAVHACSREGSRDLELEAGPNEEGGAVTRHDSTTFQPPELHERRDTSRNGNMRSSAQQSNDERFSEQDDGGHPASGKVTARAPACTPKCSGGAGEPARGPTRSIEEEASSSEVAAAPAGSSQPTAPTAARAAAAAVSEAARASSLPGGSAALDKVQHEVVQVPSVMIGKLIGKSGATIFQIQRQTGCTLRVAHDAVGTSKPVSITGTKEGVALTQQLISQVLEPGETAAPWRDAPAKRTMSSIPCHVIGRIIGRGGETIKTLQMASGAHILVNQNFPDGEPRKIELTGDDDAVSRAERMILDIVASDGTATTQALVEKYGVGVSQVLQCPRAAVGRVIGRGGEMIKNLQRQYEVSIQISQGKDPCQVTVAGPQDAVAAAVQAVVGVIDEQLEAANEQQESFGPKRVNDDKAAPVRAPQLPQAQKQQKEQWQPYGGRSFATPRPAPVAIPVTSVGAGPAGFSSPAGIWGYGQSFPFPAVEYGLPAGLYAGVYPGQASPFWDAGPQGAGHSQQWWATYHEALAFQSAAAAQWNQAQSLPAAVVTSHAHQPHRPVTGPLPVWRAMKDSKQRTYYYNIQTGVSQWQKPPGLP